LYRCAERGCERLADFRELSALLRHERVVHKNNTLQSRLLGKPAPIILSPSVPSLQLEDVAPQPAPTLTPTTDSCTADTKAEIANLSAKLIAAQEAKDEVPRKQEETRQRMEQETSPARPPTLMEREREREREHERALERREHEPGIAKFVERAHQSCAYWSVPETTYFPTLVDYFGRDWAGISSFMETKTSNMVSPLVSLAHARETLT
jgi:hypothetical protein